MIPKAVQASPVAQAGTTVTALSSVTLGRGILALIDCRASVLPVTGGVPTLSLPAAFFRFLALTSAKDVQRVAVTHRN